MEKAIPEAKLKELEDQYGEDGACVTGPEGHQVFVKRPERKEWKRFSQASEQPGKRMDALEQLLQDCRVWPDKEGLEKMLNKRPALGTLFGSKCLDLAGLVGEAEIKKP